MDSTENEEAQTLSCRYSVMSPDGHTRNSSAFAKDVFIRGSQMDRDIEAVIPATAISESSRDYKGRIRTWPGILIFVAILGLAGFFIPYFAMQTRDSRDEQASKVARFKFDQARIKGGIYSDGNDLISDDGIIGNPKRYPLSTCQLPNYISKNGMVYAVAENNTEVPFTLKGVNWFGMETPHYIPFGMWANRYNGTTAYEIASFLSANNFNVVRIPLMVQAILKNPPPDVQLINRRENRAISVRTYMSLIKSLVQAFGFRRISVIFSFHTLTASDKGGLWYSPSFSVQDYLRAVDVMTKNLCNETYWNVLGLDLKNEPTDATWGDASATDFRQGAQLIGNRMLAGCPNWLAFVEGINEDRVTTVDGDEFKYTDWWGAGLSKSKTAPVVLDVDSKVVYAPHCYTSSVYPQGFFYGNGTRDLATGTYVNYVELSTERLATRVQATMSDMFGAAKSKSGPAFILGEFGGLYSEDSHPQKTNKRSIDIMIDTVINEGYAGAILWSLNGESEYQYNPADTRTNVSEGLLMTDWLTANKPLLSALARMDNMTHLRKTPCFQIPGTSGS